jgi:protein-S-isoprenylcysteine O-methyltransferase Ste14
MIAFSGVLAMVMGEYSFSLSIILMILIWAAMMYIEIKKYKVIKTADIKDPAKHTLLKSLFYKISAVQVFLVAVMVVLMIFKAKGLIAI